MFNPTMIWFLILPVVIGLTLWYTLREDRKDSWILGASNTAVGMVIIIASFAISSGLATSDTEILNGQITSKARVHGTYEESYQCNCRTVYSGSGKDRTSHTECDTCYRTHYTVKWGCESTVGPYQIDAKDSTSSFVYNTPDPHRFTSIQPGDPASRSHRYTNFVQAVPQSLFTPSSAGLKQKFASLIPAYPDQVFDFYQVDRFLSPGFSIPEAKAWNNDISMMLRELGPKKQVNTIVVIAKTDDPNYEFALRDAWNGVKKNDVVLIIGAKEYPKIDFVRVLSWTKVELFKIELRDNIQALDTVQRAPIMALLQTQLSKNFDRRHMKEFKYLEAEIDPPTWVLVLDIVWLLAGGFLTWAIEAGYFNRFRRTANKRYPFR